MIDLEDRMVFTACALVSQRFNPINGLKNFIDMDFSTMHNWIYSSIAKAIEHDKKYNLKLDTLLEEFSKIRMANSKNQNAINNFINYVCEIADLVNSDYWNGEDVMGIFFNEFNRYKGKSEAGQVFTPDHITSLMYRLIGINKNDKVLDATCGSGAFLVKSMAYMLQEVGGINSNEAALIKSERLFGIEMYPKIYALACANMLIHKDGKTNLERLDARSNEACEWIKSKNITKVLMNPPYENKYGCLRIVKNVLDNVQRGVKCAFILPDKKLEKSNGWSKKILKEHTLTHIIKLPENIFDKGVTTSIFIFISQEPQGDKSIKGYYIENDGLVTIKNQGRQDMHNLWKDIEDYWVVAIRDDNDYKNNTKQLINPKIHLSYQIKKIDNEIFDDDFIKTMIDFQMYKEQIDVKNFKEKLANKILYGDCL